MLKILVNKTREASPDGMHVNTYTGGQTYEMPNGLASTFLKHCWGEVVKESPGPIEIKNLSLKVTDPNTGEENTIIGDKVDDINKDDTGEETEIIEGGEDDTNDPDTGEE